MFLKNLIGKFLKLKIEIPWLKVTVLHDENGREKDYIFYKSAIRIGEQNNCDITICESFDEEIAIERQGSDYFLSRNGKNHSNINEPNPFLLPNLIKLIDADVIELGHVKLKIRIGKFSLPLFFFIASPFVIVLIIIYLSSIQRVDIIKSYSLDSIKPSMNSSAVSQQPKVDEPPRKVEMGTSKPESESKALAKLSKNIEVPKKEEVDFVKEVSKPDVARVAHEKYLQMEPEEIANYFCASETKFKSECETSRNLLAHYYEGKRKLVSGEMDSAKGEILKCLRLNDDLMKGMDSHIRSKLNLLLADIFSFECEMEFNKSNHETARDKCMKALSYNLTDTRADLVIKKLELIGRKYFLEGYIYESADLSKALSSYRMVLKISQPGSFYYSKAKTRIETLE